MSHVEHDFASPMVEVEHEEGDVDLLLWITRVVAWDGILPITVSVISTGIAVLFPRNPAIQAFTMIFLPIAAFFYRYRVGAEQIRTNHCGRWLRGIQFSSLGLAIFCFLFFDCMIVLMAFLPNNGRIFTTEDVHVFTIMAGFYLVLVTIAMYPGRKPSPVVISDQRWQ